MAETSDVKAIKDLIKFWNISDKQAENIDFHIDRE